MHLLFDKVRQQNQQIKEVSETIPALQEDYMDDLEARIATWQRRYESA